MNWLRNIYQMKIQTAYLCIVIKVDWGDAQADSVNPKTVFSLVIYFLKSLTLSSCGMICGIVCNKSCGALRPLSKSVIKDDIFMSFISQCPGGV